MASTSNNIQRHVCLAPSHHSPSLPLSHPPNFPTAVTPTQEYINPHALGHELIRVQHIATVCFGIFMGVLASILNNFGITLG